VTRQRTEVPFWRTELGHTRAVSDGAKLAAGITWRPWWAMRVVYLLLVLAMIVVVAVCVPVIINGCRDAQCVADGGRGWSLGAALFAVGVAGWALSGFSLAVWIEGDELVVRNHWWRDTHIPLADVTAAEADYWGMRISCRDREPVIASALQKSNLSSWLKREVRADRIAKVIMEAADQAWRRTGGTQPPAAPGSRFPRVRLREGYEIEAVDAFFESIGGARLDQVRDVTFPVTRVRAGYDMEAVDNALDAWHRRHAPSGG
jgi:hypothetical protein